MVKCLDCGNISDFNVWVEIKKVMELELDEKGNVISIVGEPEDEELYELEELKILGDDLNFAVVSCAWCNSKNVLVDKTPKRS